VSIPRGELSKPHNVFEGDDEEEDRADESPVVREPDEE
jgi:hypothetical protein